MLKMVSTHSENAVFGLDAIGTVHVIFGQEHNAALKIQPIQYTLEPLQMPADTLQMNILYTKSEQPFTRTWSWPLPN